MLKLGLHPFCATLSSYTVKFKKEKQGFSHAISVQQHTKASWQRSRLQTWSAGWWLSFPISCCCCASPEAVYVASALQTCCIKTLVLGAMALIYRGCCFITVTLATVTQEETVFAHNSLGQKLFLSVFSVSQNLFWVGPWLFPPLFLWCFIFPFAHLHTSLHKPVALCLSMPCECFCFEKLWP